MRERVGELDKYLIYSAYQKWEAVAEDNFARQFEIMKQEMGIVDPVVTNPLRMPTHLVRMEERKN